MQFSPDILALMDKEQRELIMEAEQHGLETGVVKILIDGMVGFSPAASFRKNIDQPVQVSVYDSATTPDEITPELIAAVYEYWMIRINVLYLQLQSNSEQTST